jgi:XTP/dITP diphosphohydrolase
MSASQTIYFCGIIVSQGDAMKKSIWFSSTNKGKIQDLNEMLGDEFVIKTPSDLNLELDVEEDADTFEGNSLKKAQELFAIVHEPVIADDSGLLIEKLNGFPGVHSNRWYIGRAEGWDAINQLLLQKMRDNHLVTEQERAAKFKTVITYLDETGFKQFEGVMAGHIANKASGENGFGYDPIFIPTGTTTSRAAVSNQHRHQSSHREIAIKKLINYLKEKK